MTAKKFNNVKWCQSGYIWWQSWNGKCSLRKDWYFQFWLLNFHFDSRNGSEQLLTAKKFNNVKWCQSGYIWWQSWNGKCSLRKDWYFQFWLLNFHFDSTFPMYGRDHCSKATLGFFILAMVKYLTQDVRIFETPIHRDPQMARHQTFPQFVRNPCFPDSKTI